MAKPNLMVSGDDAIGGGSGGSCKERLIVLLIDMVYWYTLFELMRTRSVIENE